MTNNETLTPDENKLMNDYVLHREEIIEWEKYITGLKFTNINDMADFCREWFDAAYKKPQDQILQYKWSSIARHLFPVFLANFYQTNAALAAMIKEFDDVLGDNSPKTTESGVPKTDKKLN